LPEAAGADQWRLSKTAMLKQLAIRMKLLESV
jgi:hypothetical protein